MNKQSPEKTLDQLIQATEELKELRANVPRYNRRMIIMVGVVAFIIGIAIGGTVMYHTIDRITVISVGPKIQA